MAIPPVTGSNSDSANNTTINNLIRQVNNEETTKIIKDATGVRRVLIGSGANGFEGIKVSKTGIDVYTAANTDLAFNSDQNVFKIVASGTSNSAATGTITSSAGTWSTGTASVVIPHNLGYIPIPWVFINTSGVYIPIPYTATSGIGTNTSTWYTISFSAAVDTVNLTINVWVSVFGGSASQLSLPLKYYLLQETAN